VVNVKPSTDGTPIGNIRFRDTACQWCLTRHQVSRPRPRHRRNCLKAVSGQDSVLRLNITAACYAYNVENYCRRMLVRCEGEQYGQWPFDGAALSSPRRLCRLCETAAGPQRWHHCSISTWRHTSLIGCATWLVCNTVDFSGVARNFSRGVRTVTALSRSIAQIGPIFSRQTGRSYWEITYYLYFPRRDCVRHW